MTNDFKYWHKLNESQKENSNMYMLKNGVFMNIAELMTDKKRAEEEGCLFPFRKELENGMVLDYDVVKEKQNTEGIITFIVALDTDRYEDEAILLDVDKASLLGKDIGNELYQYIKEVMELEQTERKQESYER